MYHKYILIVLMSLNDAICKNKVIDWQVGMELNEKRQRHGQQLQLTPLLYSR